MKKRAFSLIEILVSLGLVALLLSTLAFWYRSFTIQKQSFNQIKVPLMEERYAHQRLHRIFPSAEPPFFTATDNSLIFIFDRGTCDNPKLSGKVLGKLYFNDVTKTLCLVIWPYPKKDAIQRTPSQNVVLLDGVAKCHFEFYSPPQFNNMPVDPEAVGTPRPRVGWQDIWLNGYKTLPALVKIVITREKEEGINNHTFEYLFDLPIGIVYPKDPA